MSAMNWLKRMLMTVHSGAHQREVDEELQFHVDMREQRNASDGMSESEARRDARVRFGNPVVWRERVSEVDLMLLLKSVIEDLRFGLRQLGRNPAFAITAAVTLALGIGANTAIFTLVNAVMLKNLPVADPRMLVRIGDHPDCCQYSGANEDGDYSLFSTDTYERFKKNAPEFEELAAMQAGFEFRSIIARQDGGREAARPMVGEFVSGNYFRMFGLQPAAGRLLSDADDVAGAPAVAVMSYETWKHEYNGAAAVIGSTFMVNTQAVTITGIAPEGFFGDRISSTPPNFYFPIETMPALQGAKFVHDPDQKWLDIIGRVKPGVPLAPLEEKLSTQLRAEFATSPIFASAHAKPMLARAHVVLSPGGAGTQAMQERYASNLRLLMWISGLVLLIACANIANLLLVRGMARKAEMSVRTALGAMRGRIVRQLLTESVLLAGIGGLAALAVSYGGTRMLLRMAFPGEQHVPISSIPSIEVLAFALVVSIVTGVVFGVAPAFINAKTPPADALRGGSRTTAGGASLLQRGLVMLQAALSIVLLVGAGLFAESLGKLQHTDMKLDSTNRYVVHFNAVAAGYRTEQIQALYRTLEQQFHAIPGVVKVGIGTYTPMEDSNNGWHVQVEGQPNLRKLASNVTANDEFFDSVGTHVLMGRGITAGDTSTSPHVAVVNEDFVETFFKPGENPIGQRFGAMGEDSTGTYQIVGVVEGTSYADVRWNAHHPMYFVPLKQISEVGYAGAIVIETARPMNDMGAIARQTLKGINPNLAMHKFETFDAQIASRFTHERMLSRLMALFGGLALLLAAVGLYGVTSYTVARRTPEIGIRMALGAKRAGVVAMVMRGALTQILVGLAIGVPAAFVCVRFVKSQLYDITSVDVFVLIGAMATLTLAACIASIIPARRAMKVNPVVALRCE